MKIKITIIKVIQDQYLKIANLYGLVFKRLPKWGKRQSTNYIVTYKDCQNQGITIKKCGEKFQVLHRSDLAKTG